MKEILRLVSILTFIGACAGMLLAFTNKVTLGPIAEAQRQETLQAISQVLPPFDNQPDSDLVTIDDNGEERTFYVARKEGSFVGAAFPATSEKGYGGPISLMVGVAADQTLRGFRVLAQQETPGLGTKIAVPPFSEQFDNRPLEGTTWAIRKDGGEFDAITGATISSRAVLEAMRNGLDLYRKHIPEIKAEPQTNPETNP